MISAFLIVLNEAENLRACLGTLAFADEIVVVDSGSEDGSVAIARRFTDRIFERPFRDFADQKNFALAQVRSEWALSVDADERVSPELRDEILETVASSPRAAGYRVPRKNFFRGQWIRCSYPDFQTRLFRKATARFVGIVHETVEIDGEIAELRSPLLHYNAPSVAAFLAKIRRYASLDARKRVESGERFAARSLWVQPVRELRRLLFQRAAYRDGLNGVMLATLMAVYAAAVSFHGLRESRKAVASAGDASE